ncbi:MAG: Ig-like domain-containing protein [Clostridia bacterium]|nr:Ig-like domain-containing protein [Clostridia bacterium]
MTKRLICLLLATALCLSSACAVSRDELRAAYRELASRRSGESPYAQQPDPTECTRTGSLTEASQQEALDYLNFLRWIAGLDPVALSPLYSLRSQNGALLLAANDEISHTPDKPAQMDDALYESALLGTSQGNLAKFNWMRPEILLDGVEYFARDDGSMNLAVLGHRRWLLNPAMAETGFGLANAASGMSYVVMYAVDDGNAAAQWDRVCWPAEGAFPVELMRSQIAWSVSLNDEIYDLSASMPVIELTEVVSGTRFSFDLASGTGDGFCHLSTEACGSGSCLIFRPDLSGAGLSEYLQNQVWDVCIDGLKGIDGSERSIEYRVEMVSLYPQDPANVELSQLEATLRVGEMLQLTAEVVPAYADDLRVTWTSSDPAVADVDWTGVVTARAPGSCEISATSSNGRNDACTVTVVE